MEPPFDSPLVAFVLTSLIVEMTPGPNMAYLAVLGASRGRLAGFSAVLGVALGLSLLGITVGLARFTRAFAGPAPLIFAGWHLIAGGKLDGQSRPHQLADLMSCIFVGGSSQTF
jgi:threonine/homoserine/homoserine lactone efflux protein